jgi:hypothetical protein
VKTGLFGFWFHHGGIATFVLDASQLTRVRIPFRDRELSADELAGMMGIAATEYDAIYFEDADTTVEPVVNSRSAPRFVVLKPKEGGVMFARMFDPSGGMAVCFDSAGQLAFDIISFADNSLELNRILYADENHGFPHSTLKKATTKKVARR